jgi:hypothetical protein
LEKWTLSGNHGSIHTINTEKTIEVKGMTELSKHLQECIWLLLKKYSWTTVILFFLPTRDILLMVLHFLKAYPTEDEGTDLFGYGSRNIYRHKLQTAIYYLDAVMIEPDLDDRLEDFIQLTPIPIFSRVSMIIDGTQCPTHVLQVSMMINIQECASKEGRKTIHARVTI